MVPQAQRVTDFMQESLQSIVVIGGRGVVPILIHVDIGIGAGAIGVAPALRIRAPLVVREEEIDDITVSGVRFDKGDAQDFAE